MRLLLCLAEHAGEVVSIDALLSEVWSGVNVSPDSVYQAVTSLRRVLGDDAKQPAYIVTAPRLGYRMVASVTPGDGSIAEQSKVVEAPRIGIRRQAGFTGSGLRRIAGATLFVLLVGLAAALLAYRNAAKNDHPSAPTVAAQAAESMQSIAVLPFLDLTEGMKEEEFADGMTEELIDKLSKIPGLRVPPPTSSFYFKGKQIAVADIAKSLGVAYVLDGSVRKSGERVRIAARLIRVDNGYIAWSETYDRPFHDLLWVQDDIAGEVTKALKKSIEIKPTEFSQPRAGRGARIAALSRVFGSEIAG